MKPQWIKKFSNSQKNIKHLRGPYRNLDINFGEIHSIITTFFQGIF